MRLDAEKWREWDRRLARLLEADAWRPEPTLLGFEHVHAELVGVVPTTEID